MPSPVMVALLEVSRVDPAVAAFRQSLAFRCDRDARDIEPTSEELAELIRLQSQRWRDVVDVLTKLYERMPPAMVMRGGG